MSFEFSKLKKDREDQGVQGARSLSYKRVKDFYHAARAGVRGD